MRSLLSEKSTCGSEINLKRCYIFSLKAFCSLRYFHQNFLAFNKSFAPGAIDSAVMHKNILAAFLLDKTVTFFLVEPFDCSFNLSTHIYLFFIFAS